MIKDTIGFACNTNKRFPTSLRQGRLYNQHNYCGLEITGTEESAPDSHYEATNQPTEVQDHASLITGERARAGFDHA